MKISCEEYLGICGGFVDHCISYQKISCDIVVGTFEREDIYQEAYLGICEFFNEKGEIEYPFSNKDFKTLSAYVNRRLRNILSLESALSVPGDYLRRDVDKMRLKKEVKEAAKRAKRAYVPLHASSGEDSCDLSIEERFVAEEEYRKHCCYDKQDEETCCSPAESQVLYETFGYGEELSSDAALALFNIFENLSEKERLAFSFYKEGYSEKIAGEKAGLGEHWLNPIKKRIKEAIKKGA